MKKEDILYIYCVFKTIKKIEKYNEIKSSVIKIQYNTELKEIEYLNIYKITYEPIFSDILTYFDKLNNIITKKEQSSNTKLGLDDYNKEKDIYSQEIIMNMYYNVKAKEEKILEEVKKRFDIIIKLDDII